MSEEDHANEGLSEPLLSEEPVDEERLPLSSPSEEDAVVGSSVEEDPTAPFLQGVRIHMLFLTVLFFAFPVSFWLASRHLSHATIEYSVVDTTTYRRDVTFPCDFGILIFQVVSSNNSSSDNAYELGGYSYDYGDTGGPCWLFPSHKASLETDTPLFVPEVDDATVHVPIDQSCTSVSSVCPDQTGAKCGHYAIVAEGDWFDAKGQQWLDDTLGQWTADSDLGLWCEALEQSDS